MKLRQVIFAVLVCSMLAATAHAQSTVVPGHRKADHDGNGITDAGANVNNHYTETVQFAPDYVCTYVVNSRGDFGNTPYLDSGWIMNNIRCTIDGSTVVWHYVFVHDTDPRYTGESWPIWGTWEWFSLVESHLGNVVRGGRR